MVNTGFATPTSTVPPTPTPIVTEPTPPSTLEASAPELRGGSLHARNNPSLRTPVLVAGAPKTEPQPNVLTLPHRWPDTLAVGTGIPGVNVGGGDATGYVLWSNQNTPLPDDDKLTFFGSLPLPRTAAGVAGLTPVVANLMTQMGGPKLASRADLVSGALYTQYQRLEQVLNSPQFRSQLPQGAKVVPTLVGSIPVDEAGKVTLGGHSQLDKAEVGLGLTVVMPGSKKNADGSPGPGTAFFINTRQNLEQLMNGENPQRSLNFGGLATGVPIKGQKFNIGPAWRATVQAPTGGPWEIRFADTKEQIPMPDAFATVANAMFDRSAPLSGTGFGRLSEIVNAIPPQTREALATTGNFVFNGVERATTVGTLVKLFGRTGGVVGALGVFSAEAISNERQSQVQQTVLNRSYVPSAALASMRGFTPEGTNIPWRASVLHDAITQAVGSGQVDAQALRNEWQGVLDGRINGGLTGRDLQAGRLLAASLLGRTDVIDRQTQLLYPNDNPYQGGVRPRGLERYAVDAFATPPQASSARGYETYRAGLYGGTVTATPSQVDRSGKAMWQVTATTGDGRTASVNVALTGQFGAQQLAPGSPTKRLLDDALQAQSGNARPNEPPRGYSNYRGNLYGGTVSAIPSQPDDRGRALWQVTAVTGDGRTASVNVSLSGQFGADQLRPGSATKRLLDQQLGRPQGYSDYQAPLYGGTVTAVPSQVDDRGNAVWQVTAVTGDGRRATINIPLAAQFGADQLRPDAPTKRLLDQTLQQQGRGDGYRTYEAGLYGGRVVATPSQPDASGHAVWQVTVYPGDGRPTVTVNVPLAAQFGPEQLQPGSYTKRLLDEALRAPR